MTYLFRNSPQASNQVLVLAKCMGERSKALTFLPERRQLGFQIFAWVPKSQKGGFQTKQKTFGPLGDNFKFVCFLVKKEKGFSNISATLQGFILSIKGDNSPPKISGPPLGPRGGVL